MNQRDLVQIIRELIIKMGYECYDIELREDTITMGLMVNARVSDTRQLIGRGGEVIQALNYIVHKIVERKTKPEDKLIQFFLDIDNYRTHQIDQLKMKAKTMADRARSFKMNIDMPPMSSYERLIVHHTLKNSPDISVISEGTDRNRHIVVKYIGEK